MTDPFKTRQARAALIIDTYMCDAKKNLKTVCDIGASCSFFPPEAMVHVYREDGWCLFPAIGLAARCCKPRPFAPVWFRKPRRPNHIALASFAARRAAMFIKLKPLPKVAGSAAGAAATRSGISAIAAPQRTGTQTEQEFAVHTRRSQEDECGRVMCTSAGGAEAADGRRASAATQNKSKQLQAAGMPAEEGGIPPRCLLTETPRKVVEGRVDADHGASDGQQISSPPPSGLWASKFHSTVRGGPHEESQEYHFHSDGRITGHITNSFSAYDIKGSWKSDGSFSYFQVGGDLVKFDGKVSGERVEGTFKSLRDGGRFSSVLVRARVERKNPKVIPRSSVRGILKTARSIAGSRRRPQARVSFPLPFVHDESI